MSCEWVSYTGTNAGFWSYEWGKHGTCALSLFPTQQDYFNASISLNNQYEATQALEASNIDPATANTQSISTLQNAFTSAWGVAPIITCNSGKVFELWLCVDTNLKAMACPSNMNYSKCSNGQGSFPPGASVSFNFLQYFLPFLLNFYYLILNITN
jgi:ribonuclease T2